MPCLSVVPETMEPTNYEPGGAFTKQISLIKFRLSGLSMLLRESSCVSHLTWCCDKTPGKNKEERTCCGSQAEGQGLIPAGEAWLQNCEVAASTASEAGSRERETGAWFTFSLFSFYSVWAPNPWDEASHIQGVSHLSVRPRWKRLQCLKRVC